MNSLSSIDLLLVFVYFAILIVIGVRTSRKQSQEDFLIAERKLDVWQTMLTVNASKTGSILVAITAMMYLFGFSAIWYFVGVIVGTLVFIPFAIRLKKKSKGRFYTMADYIRAEYGGKAAKLVAFLSVFIVFGLATINTIAGTKIFTFFTGWPFWVCAIIMGATLLFYLWMGGYRAVAKTDFIQYIAIAIIVFILLAELFDGSVVPVEEWSVFSVDAKTLFGFFLIGLVFPFASPEVWQRVYSAKDVKSLRNGFLLSVPVYAVVVLLFSLVALVVKVQFPSVDPDTALIHGFHSLLPQGLSGLAVILLFAAIMSSLDSYLFAGSASIVQDLMKKRGEEAKKALKGVLVKSGITIIVIAILIKSVVIGSFIFVSFYVVLAFPVLLTWMKENVKGTTLVVGLIFGIVGTTTYTTIKVVADEVDPLVVLVAMTSSILGLVVGGVISGMKRSNA